MNIIKKISLYKKKSTKASISLLTLSFLKNCLKNIYDSLKNISVLNINELICFFFRSQKFFC